MNLYYIKLFLFISICSFSQTRRDSIIKDSILLPINNRLLDNKNIYLKTYSILKKLDINNGYEKELHCKILEYSYLHNDSNNFKNDLTILVKEYGFKVDFLKGNESYYEAIINDNLSDWFKEMYLKNHMIWVSNNFKRLKDIRKLNEINLKDQAISKVASELITMKFNANDSIKIYTAINKINLENINDIIEISKNNNLYAGSKKFPLIQNGINNAIIHNLRDNTKLTWDALFPFIKKAYIKNEIDNVIFQNYDFYCFINNGYQEFNSYKIDQIPPQFKKGKKEIPLKNVSEFEAIKKEFNWY